MSMKSINFETGVKKYAINGDENNCIAVNVADPNLLARVEDAKAALDATIDELDRFPEMSGAERKALDEKMKNIFDKAFATDVSAHAFGEVSCFTPLASGDLLCVAFMNAFVPVVLADAEKAMTQFAKKSAKKAEAYIAEVTQAESDTE